MMDSIDKCLFKNKCPLKSFTIKPLFYSNLKSKDTFSKTVSKIWKKYKKIQRPHIICVKYLHEWQKITSSPRTWLNDFQGL